MAIILVVDDRAVNREFLAMLMGYAGHRAVEAADGAAALVLVRQLRPDLVISDIVMPTMDGLEFVRCLRADADIAHIPVIFYTASYRLGDARSMAQRCGVATVLTKPSKPQVILEAVAAALGVPAAAAPKPSPLAASLPLGAPDLNLSLRLSLLIELGLDLAAQREPQQVLDLGCRAAQDIFGVQYAAVGIVDAAAGRLSHLAAHGFVQAQALFADLDTRRGILGSVLQEGKPRRLQGPAATAQAGLPAAHPPLDALLAVPLRSAMRSYGWLYVADCRDHGFCESDEQIALTLASKLVLAYENLLLYDDLQRHAARLETDAAAIRRLNRELLQQTKAYRISETRFRLAMDAGTTLAYMLDRDLRYTWVHCGRTGCDEQSLIGKTDFDQLTEESARRLTALYGQVIASHAGLRQDVAVRLLSQPTIERYLDLIVEPLAEDAGAVAGLICVAVDISERKQIEQQLRVATDAAEQASRAKSIFLAHMSHEIRTPLHVIMGLGHLLRRKAQDPESRARLDQLCTTSDHLLDIINDILDLSKLDAQKLSLHHADFRLDAVVDKAVRMVEGMAHEKGLTLTTEVAPPLRAMTLNGDALRLGQVLINLCSNAVKFTDQGAVHLRIDCLADDADKVTLRFAVADTGIGIAPADQARLFLPFSQVDGSSTRQYEGTGLGLAISQRLMAMMGGTIQVDSRLGTGSTVSFDLLLRRATGSVAKAPAGTAVSAATDFSGRHILMVEDHPLGQEILFEMLTDIGCEVDAASDGAEAVECAQAHQYDLILMDMQMPKMNGLAATRAIRALPGHRETPIIALTANSFAEDRQRCLDAGMNSHLSKPVTPDTLATALGQWLPDLAVPSDETPPCDNELSRALAEIAQLEIRPTWRRSPERQSEYSRQLDSFVTLHGQDMTRLREHLAGGEHDAAHVVAHNLHGIAGLMGARHVAALASGIVQGLRAEADEASILLLAADCEAELANLTEAVRTLPVLAAKSAAT